MVTDQSSNSVSLETALKRLPSSSTSVTSFGDAKTLNSLSSTGSSSEGSTEISSLVMIVFVFLPRVAMIMLAS
jgi:hypothetical protein